jgi:hypothetical protein
MQYYRRLAQTWVVDLVDPTVLNQLPKPGLVREHLVLTARTPLFKVYLERAKQRTG